MNDLIIVDQWNTGRGYSEEGQVMRADVSRLDDGQLRIRFVDETRCIDGCWVVVDQEIDDFRALVMDFYDHGGYEDLQPGEAERVGRHSDIIEQALQVLEDQMRYGRQTDLDAPDVFDSVEASRRYCRLKLGGSEREKFGVVWLDTRHRFVQFDVICQGTINKAHVYAREILKAGLQCNAAAAILTHNHPSGESDPSQADIALTKELHELLGKIDINVLDHIIVTAGGSYSMAAHRVGGLG